MAARAVAYGGGWAGPVTPPRSADAAQARAAWLFLSPALLLIALFFALPVIAAFLLGFTDFDLYALADLHTVRVTGLRNYTTLFDSPLFWQALRNTAQFALIGGPLSIMVSLAAALLVNAKATRFKPFFRSVLFMPFVTTLVAVSIVWRYLYHPQYGLLNWLLGGIGVGPIDWLGNPTLAMPAIMLVAIWKGFGYNMLVFIAGLQGIPDDLYEAARLDGAGWWQQFRHVTLPMLRPTMFFVTIITMVGFFQLFAEPYVMTQGGPLRSTTSLVLLMYEEGFRWWRMGYAAAIAVVLFLVILLFTLVQRRVQREAIS